MDKEFLQGIKISLGVIFTFSILFSISAVGFHLASEILPGTFTGNYIFDGNITVNGEYKGKNVATAWVSFDATNCPLNLCLIENSFNIHNVTKISTGQYNVYFENIMDSNSYVCIANIEHESYQASLFQSGIDKFYIRSYSDGGNFYGDEQVTAIIFGGNN